MTGPAAEPEVRPARSWFRIAMFIAVVVLLAAGGREIAGYLTAFARWVESLGPWGPAAFICGYAAATVAFVPGSILSLAAGAIFGIWRGTVYVFAGAVIGSIGAFLLSRYGARRAVERRLAGSPRFAAIDRAVEAEGLMIVFLLRLSPLFPFNLLNYALGLTGVRLRDYAAASAGMLPGTLLYVYYGKVAGDLIAAAGGAGERKGAAYWAVLLLGLAATVAVTWVVTRIARKALKEYE
jgi:uncharacterized membrane protein YdjX (TVP38/TMEM64 family)